MRKWSLGSRAQPWCVRVGIWLGLAATLPLSGCSLLFVDGPPKGNVPAWRMQCTTTPGWPIVDTVLAGFELYRTGFAISRSDADYQGSSLSRPSDIAFGVSLFTLAAISAGVGYSRVNDCREVMDSVDAPRPRPRRVMPPPNYNGYQRPPAPPPPPPASPPPYPVAPAGSAPLPPPTGPAPGAAPYAPPAPPPPAAPPVQQQTDQE